MQGVPTMTDQEKVQAVAGQLIAVLAEAGRTYDDASVVQQALALVAARAVHEYAHIIRPQCPGSERSAALGVWTYNFMSCLQIEDMQCPAANRQPRPSDQYDA